VPLPAFPRRPRRPFTQPFVEVGAIDHADKKAPSIGMSTYGGRTANDARRGDRATSQAIGNVEVADEARRDRCRRRKL
jgi:hypothetical protein